MYKFDKRCFALCKACRVDDKVESIDRFVNKGMATLVDEGTEIYTNNKSPFDNEMDDFVFAGDSGPRPIEAKLKWMVQENKAMSWERANKVGHVLHAFENARFATEHKALVRLYWRLKRSADLSMVATREPKYMLEKMPVKEHVAKNTGSLFDRGTSLLRGADESIQIANRSGAPLIETLKDAKPSRDLSEMPLTEMLAQVTPRDRSDTPLAQAD
ncbi:hypothetical protein IW147_004313 [Coemansia sp. RSA 720]|nr:hypothetical protein IW147_004313 [Coemansia sp. RSA 720]